MPIVRHRFPTKGAPTRFVTDFGPAFTSDTFREELRNVVARMTNLRLPTCRRSRVPIDPPKDRTIMHFVFSPRDGITTGTAPSPPAATTRLADADAVPGPHGVVPPTPSISTDDIPGSTQSKPPASS